MSVVSSASKSDPLYRSFVARLQANFEHNVSEHTHVFTTDVDPDTLWADYLSGFATAAERQYHNCSCCKSFVRNYGGLVVVTRDGMRPAVWKEDAASGNQQLAVNLVAKRLARAKITGIFYTSDKELGRHECGGWDHLALSVPTGLRHKSRIDTANQAMAKKKEDYKNLRVAMSEYRRDLVEKVVEVLNADDLYRNDKLLGPAQFFLDLYDVKESCQFWRRVAEAPDGFCHPKSSMFGTLLDDFKAGMSYDVVKKRFESKMHPLRYQRPQAAPTEGSIKRAEEIARTLNIAPSLERRIAKVEECRCLWLPGAPQEQKTDGVFGHLRDSVHEQAKVITDAKPISWLRFQDEVLASAKSIEVWLAGRQAWYAFTTAVNPDATPIFQWDSEGERNPVAWYTRTSFAGSGGVATDYGLTGCTWVKVTGVSAFPNTWTSPAVEKRVLFFVEGAREKKSLGLALFPECMRPELREVRSVIEAHSNAKTMQGLENGTAVGIAVGDDSTLTVRVLGKHVTSVYKIDRWD